MLSLSRRGNPGARVRIGPARRRNIPPATRLGKRVCGPARRKACGGAGMRRGVQPRGRRRGPGPAPQPLTGGAPPGTASPAPLVCLRGRGRKVDGARPRDRRTAGAPPDGRRRHPRCDHRQIIVSRYFTTTFSAPAGCLESFSQTCYDVRAQHPSPEAGPLPVSRGACACQTFWMKALRHPSPSVARRPVCLRRRMSADRDRRT